MNCGIRPNGYMDSCCVHNILRLGRVGNIFPARFENVVKRQVNPLTMSTTSFFFFLQIRFSVWLFGCRRYSDSRLLFFKCVLQNETRYLVGCYRQHRFFALAPLLFTFFVITAADELGKHPEL